MDRVCSLLYEMWGHTVLCLCLSSRFGALCKNIFPDGIDYFSCFRAYITLPALKKLTIYNLMTFSLITLLHSIRRGAIYTYINIGFFLN